MELHTSESVTCDRLLAGPREWIRATTANVKSGVSVKRGTLVKYADGAVTPVELATDEVFGIMVEDVDATSAAAPGQVYLSGDFNAAAVIVPESTKASDFYAAARKVGILLLNAQ